MLVADLAPVDSSVADTVSAIEGGAQSVLIAGAPGMGKTSVLLASARRVAENTDRKVAWVSGSVVASEEHLARFLAAELEKIGMGESEPVSVPLEAVFSWLDPTETRRTLLLAIDDFDVLVFKRQGLGLRIAELGVRSPKIPIIVSCQLASVDKIKKTSAFGQKLGESLRVVPIPLLEDRPAKDLIDRRAPGLPPTAKSAILQEAGGHPAALVYLARLASESDTEKSITAFLERAAEFAGSVYAEPWSVLSPQQRAVLWELAAASKPLTAGQVAERLALPAPQVSVQLKRLINHGLVLLANRKAHFTVAPLLTRWIAIRAARVPVARIPAAADLELPIQTGTHVIGRSSLGT